MIKFLFRQLTLFLLLALTSLSYSVHWSSNLYLQAETIMAFMIGAFSTTCYFLTLRKEQHGPN